MKNDNNDLIYRFTAWLKVVVKRAKIDYLRRDKGKQSEVSLYDDDLSNKLIASDGITSASSIDFDFNNERLAKAFNKLSANRKRILIMLYVDRIPPEEIAKEYSYSLII